MKFVIDTGIMKEFIGITDNVATEIRLHIEEDRVWYSVVDTGNVAMVKAELPYSLFTTFDIEPCVLCVDLVKFKQVFQFKGSEISISIGEDPSRAIVKSGGYEYTMTLLSENTVKKDPNMPSFELSGAVEINGPKFVDAVKVIGLTDAKIKLSINEGVFSISAKDIDENSRPFGADELINITGSGTSIFSLDYLRDIGSNIKSDAEIKLGDDYPCMINFKIANGKGSAVGLIAPRIEQEC